MNLKFNNEALSSDIALDIISLMRTHKVYSNFQ